MTDSYPEDVTDDEWREAELLVLKALAAAGATLDELSMALLGQVRRDVIAWLLDEEP